jgi:uncharacterized repeat protein (TIGR01451 family)
LSYVDSLFFPRVLLDYSVVFGGNGDDTANGIAVDQFGRAYVVGVTNSTNFPVVGSRSAPFMAANAGGNCGSFTLCGDVFLARLSPGGALDYTALWGATSQDTGNGVALRAANDVVLAVESFDLNATIQQWRGFAIRAVTGSDLSLAKTCQPDPVHAGSSLACTITVTNAGPEDAGPFQIIDRPLQRAQFDLFGSTSTSCQAIYDARQFIDHFGCTALALPANSSRTQIDHMLPLSRGPFSDQVSIDYMDDWNLGNNSATSTVTVVADTNLSVFQSHTPEPVPLGSDVTYTIWGSNNGADVASGIDLTTQIPAGMTVSSVTTGAGSCTPTQGTAPLTVDCGMDFLTHNLGPFGTSAFAVTVVAHPAAVGIYPTVASITGQVTETVPADNQMSDVTNVILGHPAIKMTGNLVSRRGAPGGTLVSIELETRNLGNGNAQNLQYLQIAATATGGTGNITTQSALPTTTPILGPGRSQSYVVVLQVPAGVTTFNLAVSGNYQDFSGSGMLLPFGGTFPF